MMHSSTRPLYCLFALATLAMPSSAVADTLDQNRDRLIRDWSTRKGHADSCVGWNSLDESAKSVFIWNTHRLHQAELYNCREFSTGPNWYDDECRDGSYPDRNSYQIPDLGTFPSGGTMLDHIDALYEIYGRDPGGGCGGGDYNRTFMSMDHELWLAANWAGRGFLGQTIRPCAAGDQGPGNYRPALVARGGGVNDAYYGRSGDCAGPHSPLTFSIASFGSRPRAQLHLWSWNWRTNGGECTGNLDPNHLACETGGITSDVCSKLSDRWCHTVTREPTIGSYGTHPLVGAPADPYLLEMDQDYEIDHDSSPECAEMRRKYSEGYGDPGWDWAPTGCTSSGSPPESGYTNIVYLHGRQSQRWDLPIPVNEQFRNRIPVYDGSARLTDGVVRATVNQQLVDHCTLPNECIVVCHSAGCNRLLYALDELDAQGNLPDGILWTEAGASAAGGSGVADKITAGGVRLLAKLFGQAADIDYDLGVNAARSTFAFIQNASPVAMYHVAGGHDWCIRLLGFKVLCGNTYLMGEIGDGLVGPHSACGYAVAAPYSDCCSGAKYVNRLVESCSLINRDHFGIKFEAQNAAADRLGAARVAVPRNGGEVPDNIPDCDITSCECDVEVDTTGLEPPGEGSDPTEPDSWSATCSFGPAVTCTDGSGSPVDCSTGCGCVDCRDASGDRVSCFTCQSACPGCGDGVCAGGETGATCGADCCDADTPCNQKYRNVEDVYCGAKGGTYRWRSISEFERSCDEASEICAATYVCDGTTMTCKGGGAWQTVPCGCGDGFCTGAETAATCPADCRTCDAAGGNTCESTLAQCAGETLLDSVDCPVCCDRPLPTCGAAGGNTCEATLSQCLGRRQLQSSDCEICCVVPVCGNDVCEGPDENCANCLNDCPCPAGDSCDTAAEACVAAPNACGNGLCEGPDENCNTCAADCGCPPDLTCAGGVCGCGDGTCTGPEENCANCFGDCPCPENYACDVDAAACVVQPGCGNGICEAGEDCTSCADCDCAAGTQCDAAGQCVTYCGNGTCDGGETCASCSGDCGCSPTICSADSCVDTCMSGGDVLYSGQELCAGGSLTSGNGVYRLQMQADGNLELHDTSTSTVLWSSGSSGSGATAAHMQGDGNLVLYPAGSSPVWASNSLGTNPSLIVQNDGNVVIYAPGPIWSTNTVRCGDTVCDDSETCESCPTDCGSCCGDGACVGNETCTTCPTDCGSCCGNGACDNGETCATCNADCGCGATVCSAGACTDTCISGTDFLYAGQELCAGASLVSANGRFTLSLLDTGSNAGNLVLYDVGTAIWSTKTLTATALHMQGDGNLVLYSETSVVWASNSSGGNPYLLVQNDGNAVVYAGGVPVWATNTVACGNGSCDGAETCSTCPDDCGACCGNGTCDNGETCSTCAADCGSCCGNGSCDNGETCGSCATDCGSCCGNGTCDNGESCFTCATDCGCGSTVCSGGACTDTCINSGDKLYGGQELCAGGALQSSNGRFELKMQADGNLVLKDGGTPIWATNTNGSGATAAHMQGDGNLVLYPAWSSPAWASNSSGSSPHLLVQNDGNVVIYAPSAVWESGTCVTCGGNPNPNSCVDTGSCGSRAPGGCWCDANCSSYGDCCFDGPC